MKRHAIVLFASLSLLSVSNFASAAPQGKHAGDNNPDVIAIRQYRLTMDNVLKLVAAQQAMNKMVAADPGLKKKVDASGDNDESIDQKVKRFDTDFPQLVAVVRANGLSTRDYVMTSLAFLNDVMVVGMKKEGMIKEYPANSITPENAAFVEQNYEKLKEASEKLTPPDSDH